MDITARNIKDGFGGAFIASATKYPARDDLRSVSHFDSPTRAVKRSSCPFF